MKAPKGKIIVLPDAKEAVTGTGIHIPQQSQEKSKTGVVVEAGEDIVFPSKGDRVIFHTYTGVEFVKDGVTYLIMKADEPLTVI